MVIDRYGVICLIEMDAMTSLQPFVNIVEYFTAEEYAQQLFSGIGKVPSVFGS